MVSYFARRLGSSALVLLISTFLMYLLIDFVIRPLDDLMTSTAPNKQALINARIELLDLDTPAPVRYLGWLRGVGGCVVGNCDLGTAWRTDQLVTSQLASAVPTTLRLILIATVLAMVLGVVVGIVSALRQYSGFDYGIIFLSFLLYSLPTFWVAVLLKQWVAIGFNNFLEDDPSIAPAFAVCVALAVAVIVTAAIGGSWKRRLITFASAIVASLAVLGLMELTGFIENPSIGIVGVALTGAGIAVVVTLLSSGLENRRSLGTALSVAALGVALYYPLQPLFGRMTTPLLLGLAVVAVLSGIVVGYLWGGPDKRVSARTGAFTAILVAFVIYADRIGQAWAPYVNSSVIGGRPIATVGIRTPNLSTASYWITQLDAITHLVMPTLALVLISFAGYTRYSRASMLEVMNQDYIRTARAKGLNERTVVMRHAFRTTLIPLATIIPIDFASILGGAVITERIFGWSGMGTLFIRSLDGAEIDPMMAFILITGALAIFANFVADLIYAALDPRIRVNA